MIDWMQRWKDGETFWHKEVINDKLVKFIDCLKLQAGETVFVPLCGKSCDMIYLLKEGYKVVAVELSSLAIEAFFYENAIAYTVQKAKKFSVYNANNIRIFCGDYFDIDASHLDKVSAVYDRASFIALPADLRVKYSQHLHAVIPSACQVLLLTLNYPQSQMSGPPFAVNEAEVNLLFKEFECQQLQCFNDIENEPKFQKLQIDFVEKAVYCLHKK